MKKLRTVLSLLLAVMLLSGAALAETYAADWGDGVTLNFEIDDSLRQPLDIFDAAYSLDLEPTDNNLNQAKALMQKGMELTFKGAIPAILMPVIVLGGIYGGIFTPTECSVVGVVYTLLVGKFVYHELTFKKLKESLVEGLPGLIILRGHHSRIDTALLRPLKSVSRAVIADYNGDLRVGHASVSNAVDDRLEIGPAAGDQDCHSQHKVTPFSPASI